MPRPKQCRRVCVTPDCTYFKPAGIPSRGLQEVIVTVDELEALRLADAEGLYHQQAAERMRVSRRTFGRIIDSARRKVAQALIQGKALRIQGGVIEMAEQRTFRCRDCEHEWQLPFGTGRPSACPQCASENFHRAEEERGRGSRRRRQRGSGTGEPAPVGSNGGPQIETETATQAGRGRQRRCRRRGAVNRPKAAGPPIL
jgi:predicted DNA-binding protein (UPF0251 family)